MRQTIIFILGYILCTPIPSMAEENRSVIDISTIEGMSIEALIEKLKEASSEDKVKIENLIKKKIAQAHRKNAIKG